MGSVSHDAAATSPAPAAPAPRTSAESIRPSIGIRPPTEIRQLTGLRFVAAGWVVVHHVSFVPVAAFAALLAPLAPFAAAGPLGVDLFFVLSGLVLARAYLDRWSGPPRPRAVLAFLRARVARVWPLYLVVTVVTGLWCAARAAWGTDGVVAWQSTQPDLGVASWLRQLTMTQLWTAPDIQGISFALPLWSVSAEWLAYLLFPLLGVAAWGVRRWPRPVLAVIAVGLAGAATLAAGLAVTGVGSGLLGGFAGPWLLRVLGEVSAGIVTWLVVRRVPASPTVARWAHRIVLGVVAETLLVAYWAGSAPATAALATPARLTLAVPLFPVLLGALVLADPTRPGPARWLSGPRMGHGGRISYALYLVHFPMIEVFVVATTRVPALAPDSSLAALLLPHVVLASLGVAALAHRWVEVPARRWLAPGRRREVRPAGDGRSAAGRGAAPT